MSRATGTELTPECPPIASAEVCYLVDDDPSVRKSISRLLESEGFNARAFGTRSFPQSHGDKSYGTYKTKV